MDTRSYQEIIEESKNLNQKYEDEENNFYKQEKHRKTLWKILFAYIAVQIIATIFILGYSKVRFPNAAESLDLVSITNVSVEYNQNVTDLTINDYIVTGQVTNYSSETFPVLSITLDFLDGEGKTLFSKVYTFDDVKPNDIIQIYDEFTSDQNSQDTSFSVMMDESAIFYTITNLVTTFITLLVVIYISISLIKSDALKVKNDFMETILSIVLGVVLIYGTMIVASVILELLGVSGTSENEETIASMFSSDTFSIVSLFLLLVVFTPFLEEMVFRKSIYGLIKGRWGSVAAIIISGSVFGLMHVVSYGDFIQSIPYIAMGLSFGYMYYRSKENVFVTIVMHMINNLIAFIGYVVMLSII